MESGSLYKASALPSQVKQALETLLGRALQEDESVSIRTYRTKEAPTGLSREAPYRRLLDRGEKTAEKTRDTPETELDAAIDEAADAVRHNRE